MKTPLSPLHRHVLAGLALPALLTLGGCAEILVSEAARLGTQQCNQLSVPAQREECLRDVGSPRALQPARSAETPRVASGDNGPAVRNDAAAAKAASRPTATPGNP